MDLLVRIFAPRGRLDYVGKALWLLLILGAMNWLRDLAEHGAGADTFYRNFAEATIVGLLPTLLALGLIAHLRSLKVSLEQAVRSDPLTGLPNRRGFFEDAPVALQWPGSVLMLIDADHFKAVNDSFGHGTGDRCLIGIADHLRRHLGPEDVIGRLGGEEFGAVLVARGADVAHTIGQRLVSGIDLAVPGRPDPHRVTLSIGAVAVTGAEDVTQLLRLADAALYQAKQTGRARIVFAGPEAPPPGAHAPQHAA